MKDICLASGNADKLLEFRAALEPLGYRLQAQSAWPDFVPAEETGSTLQENALLKARALFRHTGREAVSDDTGLLVEALDGAPGVYSARYAGPGASYSDNVNKLLRELGKRPREERGARFETVIAVVGPGHETCLCGACEGWITEAPRGNGTFGYDPVFEAEHTGRTFAQMDLPAKNQISHRGRALQALAEWLAAR